MSSLPASERPFEALRHLALAGPIRARVRGGCMLPHLADGETVWIERRRAYWPGDVVVFAAADGLRAHRMLGYRPTREGWVTVTRPDASVRAWDPGVRPRRILGRVAAVAGGDRLRVRGADRMRALVRFSRLLGRWLLRSARR